MNQLMDGVTILNQSDIMTTPDWVLWLALASLGIFFAGSLITCTNIEMGTTINKIGACIVFIGMAMIFISIITIATAEEPTGKYKYECLVDEDVALADFYDKYEVVEVKGKIWIIKEK